MAIYECPKCGKLSPRSNFYATHKCELAQFLKKRQHKATQSHYEDMMEKITTQGAGHE